jgi:hypothetical protein
MRPYRVPAAKKSRALYASLLGETTLLELVVLLQPLGKFLGTCLAASNPPAQSVQPLTSTFDPQRKQAVRDFGIRVVFIKCQIQKRLLRFEQNFCIGAAGELFNQQGVPRAAGRRRLAPPLCDRGYSRRFRQPGIQ